MDNSEILESLVNFYERRESSLKRDDEGLTNESIVSLVNTYARPLAEDQRTSLHKQEYTSFIWDLDKILLKQKDKKDAGVFYLGYCGGSLGWIPGLIAGIEANNLLLAIVGSILGSTIFIIGLFKYTNNISKSYKHSCNSLIDEYSRRLDLLNPGLISNDDLLLEVKIALASDDQEYRTQALSKLERYKKS